MSYNADEIAILREAAERDGAALAAWVAGAALTVATGVVVPVSENSKEVLQEQLNARRQVARIGNNLNQMQRVLNTADSASVADWEALDLDMTAAQVQAVLTLVEKAVKRLDEATIQVMRERRRS